MRDCFNAVFVRFHLTKPNTLIFQGFFPHDNPLGYEIVASVNNKKVPIEFTITEGNEVRRRYITAHKDVSQEILGVIELPENLESIKGIRIRSEKKGLRSHTAFFANPAVVKRLSNQYNYNFESSHFQDDKIRIMGWTVAIGQEEFRLFEGDREIPITVTRRYRKDVMGVFPEITEEMCKDAGLEIEFEKDEYKYLHLQVTNQGKTYDLKLDTLGIMAGGELKERRTVTQKIAALYCDKGFWGSLGHVFKKLKKEEVGYTYDEFRRSFKTDKAEIERQRNTRFDRNPIISIVVPMYDTSERYLFALIDSCMSQTYDKWQLCLADGSKTDELGKTIAKRYPKESRIVYKHLEENAGIAANTNAALKLATGDFIALADHDDLLSKEAMWKIAEAVNSSENVEVIYSDEDKVDGEGKQFFEPAFKPDYSIDYLCDVNY
ncbi:MAG: glycosyltransferase, partial [Pseudobutyrivibrio sp.]|nr:glycosyltransferase [Pseudobutyrivibrio sp.]